MDGVVNCPFTGSGAFGRLVSYSVPTPPSAPQKWAHKPSWPIRTLHPLDHSDWVKDGHVISAGPNTYFCVIETLGSLPPSAWELEKYKSWNARGWERGHQGQAPWVPTAFLPFPCGLRKLLLGFLTCKMELIVHHLSQEQPADRPSDLVSNS